MYRFRSELNVTEGTISSDLDVIEKKSLRNRI